MGNPDSDSSAARGTALAAGAVADGWGMPVLSAVGRRMDIDLTAEAKWWRGNEAEMGVGKMRKDRWTVAAGMAAARTFVVAAADRMPADCSAAVEVEGRDRSVQQAGVEPHTTVDSAGEGRHWTMRSSSTERGGVPAPDMPSWVMTGGKSAMTTVGLAMTEMEARWGTGWIEVGRQGKTESKIG